MRQGCKLNMQDHIIFVFTSVHHNACLPFAVKEKNHEKRNYLNFYYFITNFAALHLLLATFSTIVTQLCQGQLLTHFEVYMYIPGLFLVGRGLILM